MAKKSAIERNKKRERLAERYKAKRDSLREIIRAKDDKGEFVHPIEERFRAQLKLAELPRNSAPNRVRNRCGVTGRPRAFYRKLKMSRIALREFAGRGLIPGMVKSSW